jgi:hypothetical protein
MTEVQTKHTYVVTIDKPSIEASRTNSDLLTTIICLAVQFDKQHEVTRSDGTYLKKECVF